LFEGQKKKNFVCGIAIPLSQRKHLNYKNNIKMFLRNLDEVLLDLVLEFITDASVTWHGL